MFILYITWDSVFITLLSLIQFSSLFVFVSASAINDISMIIEVKYSLILFEVENHSFSWSISLNSITYQCSKLTCTIICHYLTISFKFRSSPLFFYVLFSLVNNFTSICGKPSDVSNTLFQLACYNMVKHFLRNVTNAKKSSEG